MTSTITLPLVDLAKEIPALIVDLKYATSDNFTGQPAPDYKTLRPMAHPEMAAILRGAAQDLESEGYSLVLFDAFRPESTIQYFVEWALQPENNQLLKERFYPRLQKSQLLEDGYISRLSPHGKGLAVDVTLARRDVPLDMGTQFDFFDFRSHTDSRDIPEHCQDNRQQLKSFLEKHGLKNYRKEWWHFSLRL
ncbi:MAG: D-Ala-D-Ala dipeptidase VanX [Bdellovibrio sp.]|nr:D-Ala-D-Ala dipeptidase VanX [Bdellovibrio sp.]